MKKMSKMAENGIALAMALCMAASFAGCSSAGANGTSASGTSGSTTAAGDTADTVSTGAASLEGSVSTNGSTSMESVIGILSEQFMNDNPGVTVTYDATGSGTGIESVSNGTCDIGLASRNLKAEETGLTATTLALDGIAIIVNGDSTLEDLSLDDIAAIYTGKITDWSGIGDGSASGEISVIGREAGSGTRDGFESITGTTDNCVLNQELTSTGAVIEAVKSTPNAIGYASFASVEGQEGIKILTVGGVTCSEENISNGTYVIQRPFNLITKDGVELSAPAQAFFDYMTSSDASDLIAQSGAVPVA